jgi:RNA polymerase sigma factor (sigma-70 family)
MGAMDLVFNLSRRLTDNRQDAEDLAQETYLRAFRAWKDHRRPRNVEPWLATICLNLARSRFRARGRRPAEVPLQDWMGEERSGDDPEVRAVERIERDDLYRAIRALPEVQRVQARRPRRSVHLRSRRGDGNTSGNRSDATPPGSPGVGPAAR